MNSLSLAGSTIGLDQDGHLRHPGDWSPDVAEALAQREGLTLDKAHWEIIALARAFYDEFQLAPNMRALVHYVKALLGQDKGNSLYINRLFQGSPARRIARLAGLPKPNNCL